MSPSTFAGHNLPAVANILPIYYQLRYGIPFVSRLRGLFYLYAVELHIGGGFGAGDADSVPAGGPG